MVLKPTALLRREKLDVGLEVCMIFSRVIDPNGMQYALTTHDLCPTTQMPVPQKEQAFVLLRGFFFHRIYALTGPVQLPGALD